MHDVLLCLDVDSSTLISINFTLLNGLSEKIFGLCIELLSFLPAVVWVLRCDKSIKVVNDSKYRLLHATIWWQWIRTEIQFMSTMKYKSSPILLIFMYAVRCYALNVASMIKNGGRWLQVLQSATNYCDLTYIIARLLAHLCLNLRVYICVSAAGRALMCVECNSHDDKVGGDCEFRPSQPSPCLGDPDSQQYCKTIREIDIAG